MLFQTLDVSLTSRDVNRTGIARAVIKITYWHVSTPTLECVRCRAAEFSALCVKRGFEPSVVRGIIPVSALHVAVHC